MKGSPRTLLTVDKALQILQLMATRPGDWGVTELAAQTGQGRSVVHSILQTLVARGFAEQDSHSKRYRLGRTILVLAQAITDRADLRQVARGPLRELALATGECAYLLVPAGDACVTIDRAEPPEVLRVTTEVGSLSPLHAGSNPKAILAFLPPAEIERYLARPLQRVSCATVTDPEELRRQLAAIRAQGYAYTEEELFEGIAGIAAPIFNRYGEVVGSVGIGGLVARVRAGRHAMVGHVLRAARAISAALGYEPPPIGGGEG